jgi:hypothetical protein
MTQHNDNKTTDSLAVDSVSAGSGWLLSECLLEALRDNDLGDVKHYATKMREEWIKHEKDTIRINNLLKTGTLYASGTVGYCLKDRDGIDEMIREEKLELQNSKH